MSDGACDNEDTTNKSVFAITTMTKFFCAVLVGGRPFQVLSTPGGANDNIKIDIESPTRTFKLKYEGTASYESSTRTSTYPWDFVPQCGLDSWYHNRCTSSRNVDWKTIQGTRLGSKNQPRLKNDLFCSQRFNKGKMYVHVRSICTRHPYNPLGDRAMNAQLSFVM